MAKRITKFSQITEQLPYPSQCRGLLQSMHSTVVSEVLSNTSVTRSYCKRAVHIINMISYYCICQPGELVWDSNKPLAIGNDDIEEDSLELQLRDMYLSFRFIKWEQDGIKLVAESVTSSTTSDVSNDSVNMNADKPVSIKPKQTLTIKPNSSVFTIKPTTKEDLSIQPPGIPQVDFTKVRCSVMFGDRTYAIYESFPVIPSNQNQISITTDISKMSANDFHNLYPNCRILTRHQPLYDKSLANGLEFHPVLGAIIPVEGFTTDQIIDNMVRYPHLYKLSKLDGDEIIGFYSTIEINGELHKTLKVWETLPESKVIPPIKDYMQEYVVRRYLLERDIKGVKHKYPMFGTLEPFLTLFTTPDEYIDLGYTDIDGMARQCVLSRVSYKRSRNPILRIMRKMEGTTGVSVYNTLW